MSETGTAPEDTRQPPAAQIFTPAAVLLLLWLCTWIVLSWPYSLDDALIHLRYADNLLRHHRVTYDGVHASFGTSSLLYVSGLATLRTVFSSPLLPRAVTSVVYVVLFLAVAAELRRTLTRNQQPAALWMFGIALLAIMVAPSAVRWLDDGMETGLVFLAAFGGVLLARRLIPATHSRPGLLFAAFFYGLFTVLLRVELLLLVLCVSAMVWLGLSTGRVRRMMVEHPGRAVALTLAPAVGGVAAAALILLSMHVLLPDTAVAKAFGLAAWRDTFLMTGITIASSFSFGLGLLVLWIASAVLLVMCGCPTWADLPGNLLFPCVLLSAALRGQQVQGIRYFGWTFFFPLLWNLLRVAEERAEGSHGFRRGLQLALSLFVLALVPAFFWESSTFHRLFVNRGATLNEFRSQPQLAAMQGKLGIAEDVGFIGYFTRADICDPYGLINGRAAAKLNYAQRFDHCMAMHPVFAFGSREFLQKVTSSRSLAGWSICGSYAFDNVHSRDVHYLVVDPGEAREACPSTATPIAKVLPGLL